MSHHLVSTDDNERAHKVSICNSSFRHGYRVDVAGTGFTVLDRVYADGDLADEALGGSCGNVLVSLAMLHRHVAPVLALGDDDAGGRLIDEFVQAGATIQYITRRADVRSPVLAQELNTASGRHDFSFVCPELARNCHATNLSAKPNWRRPCRCFRAALCSMPTVSPTISSRP